MIQLFIRAFSPPGRLESKPPAKGRGPFKHAALQPGLAVLSLLLNTACCLGQPEAKPGAAFDLQGYVDKAVASGAKQVRIPPGQYRVTPRKQQHLVLKNLSGVEIDATGVEMICTETTRALTIDNCRDVTLRGLSIDYDPLPFTQGRIVALSPDKSQIEVELFKGYPDTANATTFKIEIFNPATRTLRTHDYGWEKNIEKLSPTRLRLTKTRGRADDLEQAGDILVMGNSHVPGGEAPHAVYLTKSARVRLENINLWASNCFGFLETLCERTTYYRCRIGRRDGSDDPVKRESPRIRSLNADAYHSKNAVVGPALVESSATFMGDDAVNICGDYHIVTEGSGASYRVLAKGTLFGEGDLLELFTYEGLRLPDTKVVKIVPDGEINDRERAFLREQRMDAGLRTKWTPKAYRITLERAVPLTWFSVVASTRSIGNGFVVKDCAFGFNRSRGILIKASDGLISGNTLVGSRMSAISIAPEYWWLESGSSNNLRIEGNRIRDCGETPISVTAKAGNGSDAPSGAHNNILIASNTVASSPAPYIRVTSTTGLRIEQNTLPAPPAGGKPSPPVEIINCDRPVMK